MDSRTSFSTELKFALPSSMLDRSVNIHVFTPKDYKKLPFIHLLLVNDGQDLKPMKFIELFDDLVKQSSIDPLVVVGIEAGDRIHEYGTAEELDYLRRGSKSGQYTQFIFSELLPELNTRLHLPKIASKGFAGFSLGGLSALDIVWHYPHIFHTCGVFSGSLWWRKKRFDPKFPDSYRIMHELVEKRKYTKGQRFWFQCGTEDETEDRNNNGIIDSIDDTLDLIAILKSKGYKEPEEVNYLEIDGGTHDVATWGRAFPHFLKWAYPRKETKHI